MNIIELDQAIKAVCPIDGVSIGRKDDPKTWRIDYRPEATPAQRQAAQTIISQLGQIDNPSAAPSEARQLADLLTAKGILTTADAATFEQGPAPAEVVAK